jgi:hypothetical protein
MKLTIDDCRMTIAIDDLRLSIGVAILRYDFRFPISDLKARA